MNTSAFATSLFKTLLLGSTVVFSAIACGGGGGSEDGDFGEAEPEEVSQAQLAANSAPINDSGSPNARLLFSEDFTGGQARPDWTEVVFETENYADTPQFAQIAGRWAAVYHLIARSQNGNEQSPFKIIKFDFTNLAGTPEVDEIIHRALRIL